MRKPARETPSVFIRRHRRTNRFVFPLAIFLTALMTSGCGFHLRGSYNVPAFLQEVTVRTPTDSRDLERELKLALERNNIVPQGGEATLEVTRESLTRQTATVDSSARAAEYTLIYTVEFRVSRSDGKAMGPLQSLILRRSYQYSSTNIVGKGTEEATLLRELRMDAAQQIVRQLAATKSLPEPLPAGAAGDSPTAAPATPAENTPTTP